jgi:starch synthase
LLQFTDKKAASMEIIHISAECYPVAKAGGLGDVVGALPKYQNKLGHIAKVVMPMYRTKFLYEHSWELVHEGATNMGLSWFRYSVIKEKTNTLGFDLYLVDINGLLDREKVYGYDDDSERFLAFQIATLHWMNQWQHNPDVVHCHDHHTGLVPFMMKFCYGLEKLRPIRTVFTVHNAQYQGWMGWGKRNLIPDFDNWKTGMLDWRNNINPLASAIKCADKVTTVSPSYLAELRSEANGLEALFEYERGKCFGILNGIDNEVWNPETDPMLHQHYNADTVSVGKAANKKIVCEQFGIDPTKPLFTFIGRLVGEKAAEILPSAVGESVALHQGNVCFVILGSGDPSVEYQLRELHYVIPNNYNCFIGYNEKLAHQMYAAADFLLMPSRVEPCGLNQMYALRYGTIPVVRRTGGLQDTVVDIAEPDFKGYGILFNNPTVWDLNGAISRAVGWYYDEPGILDEARKKMMAINNSWENSAAQYIELYNS